MTKRTDLKSKRPVKQKVRRRLQGSFIGLRIDDDLKARLEEFGEQEGKSTSDVLKDLITKHVETKEAVDAIDDAIDLEEDAPGENGNFHSQTGKPLTRKKVIVKKKGQPVGQVNFETLLDDLLRYQSRFKELNALIKVYEEEDDNCLFGDSEIPPHLLVAKTVCEKKLKLIAEQMKALFPDVPKADREEEEEEESLLT